MLNITPFICHVKCIHVVSSILSAESTMQILFSSAIIHIVVLMNRYISLYRDECGKPPGFNGLMDGTLFCCMNGLVNGKNVEWSV